MHSLLVWHEKPCRYQTYASPGSHTSESAAVQHMHRFTREHAGRGPERKGSANSRRARGRSPQTCINYAANSRLRQSESLCLSFRSDFGIGVLPVTPYKLCQISKNVPIRVAALMAGLAHGLRQSSIRPEPEFVAYVFLPKWALSVCKDFMF